MAKVDSYNGDHFGTLTIKTDKSGSADKVGKIDIENAGGTVVTTIGMTGIEAYSGAITNLDTNEVTFENTTEGVTANGSLFMEGDVLKFKNSAGTVLTVGLS